MRVPRKATPRGIYHAPRPLKLSQSSIAMNTFQSLRLVGVLALSACPLLLLPACKPAGQPAAPTAPAAQTAAKPAAAPAIISAAPAWQVTTLDGKTVGLEQLKGKVVVVDFWATWCGPCVHEIPGYIELQKKYADRGLVVVGLSLDENGAAVVSKFAAARGMNYPVALATPEIINAFGGIESIPTTFLIDRAGQIRHRKLGAMTTADYEQLIVSLL
jgi:thiol-disulfide isomerase/thioredoxin